jgi:uncharacterized surface protein with fasciclin (FAS1) repeats
MHAILCTVIYAIFTLTGTVVRIHKNVQTFSQIGRPSIGHQASTIAQQNGNNQTLLGTLSQLPAYSNFTALLVSSGTNIVLETGLNFTVFAPNNNAFAAVPGVFDALQTSAFAPVTRVRSV